MLGHLFVDLFGCILSPHRVVNHIPLHSLLNLQLIELLVLVYIKYYVWFV